jgi:hypothetical protein
MTQSDRVEKVQRIATKYICYILGKRCLSYEERLKELISLYIHYKKEL